MTVAFIADVHVGNMGVFGGPLRAGVNDRARYTLAVLERAVSRAEDLGADTLVIAGDLFDVDHPSPQILAETIAVLGERLRVIAVVGNHDQRSATPGDHALAPLAAVGTVTVLDAPTVLPLSAGLYLLAVPFRRDPAAEYLPDVVRFLRARLPPDARAIVAAHAGLSDARTPAFLLGAHDALPAADVLDLLAEDPRTFAAVVGNWHGAETWTRPSPAGEIRAEQCGALVPTGFNNPGGEGYGALVLYDPEADHWHRETLTGPRFYLLAGDLDTGRAELAAAEANAHAEPLFVSWKLPPETDREAAAALLRASRAQGWRLQRDTRAAARQSSAAGAKARAEGTVEAAAAAYVQAMPLPPRVERARVLSLVRGFLGL